MANTPSEDLKATSDAEINKKLADLKRDLDRLNFPAKAGKKVPYIFATAGLEEPVKHGLNRAPVGFMIVDQRTPGIIYRGGTRSDSTNFYLKSNTNAADVDIWFY